MAERPKPDNVVPFRKPPGPPRFQPRVPKWIPRDLYVTVTGWIILANVGIWLVMVVVSRGQGIATMFPPDTTFAFGSANTSIIFGEPWRIVSAAFLHVGLGHLFANMFGLYIGGFPLERAFGSGRMAAIYFASAIAGSLLSLGWHVLLGGGSSVGASGAVLGVMGGLTAFYWRATGRHSPMTKTFLAYTGVGLVMGFLTSLIGGAIDNAAHVGGLVAGAAISWLFFSGSPSWKGLASRSAIALLFVAGLGSVGASLASTAMRGSLPAPPPSAAAEAFERGRRALAAEDWSTAESQFQIAIEAGGPEVPMIRTLRATALQKLDRNDEAIAEMETAVREFEEWRAREPNNAVVALLHGMTLREMGRDDDAIAAFVAGTRARAPDGRTFSQLSEQLEELGRLEDARLAAAKARIAEPRNELYKLQHQRINEKIAAGASATPPEPVPSPT